MATSADSHRIYCYPFWGCIWIGWIVSLKLERPILYCDDTPTAIMYPESWLDYVTIGLSQESVANKLRRRYEKLKNLHSKH